MEYSRARPYGQFYINLLRRRRRRGAYRVCMRPQQDEPGPAAVIGMQGSPIDISVVSNLDAAQKVI
jgi:hypothetical protein